MSIEPHDIVRSHAIAQKIFAKATLAKFELVPEVYEVWYAYYAASHPRLNADVDAIVAAGKPLDMAAFKALHDRHLLDTKNSTATQQILSDTQLLLKGVFDEIITANQSTADYGKNLESYTSQLNNVTQVADVKSIITKLIKDTSAAATSGHGLQEKLAAATAKTEMLEKQLAQTQKEATIDTLTGLHNRRAFDAKLKELFTEFRQHGHYFSVIMVDIDFFKKFNDTYGHQTGDLVLATVGDTLYRSLKGDDFPARYGGEEFIILLPETSLENAVVVAEQLRVRISLKKIDDERHPDVTLKVAASLGVSFSNKQDTLQTVVDRADKALYHAKKTGRNRVCSELDLS
jgi:diguanylate cyclase